jgi:hypothetical protein
MNPNTTGDSRGVGIRALESQQTTEIRGRGHGIQATTTCDVGRNEAPNQSLNHDNIHAGDKFQRPICVPTWGAIFEDIRLYENYARWSGAFLLIHRSTFELDHSKQVALSPRTLCKSQPMSVNPPLHSLEHELWYYPPLVHDIMMELETAAHGYMEQLDILNPTKVSKRKQDKRENRKADKGKPVSYLLCYGSSQKWPSSALTQCYDEDYL